MKTTVLVLVFCFVSSGFCHVRQTFPPAREYDIDFLDNVRTSPPCGGMDYHEGMPITTLKTGETITLTWHGAYPHMGGIRYELLDLATSDVTASLTGTGYSYTNDTTTQSHELTLTDDHVCDHCILRLIRQAGEWTAGADGYLFWSCADVKIMAGTDDCYSGKCLNGGSCATGTCTCPKTYLGDRCQYKNDCEDATDCNSNGACIDLDSTFFPSKVCYCNAGKMGRFCSKDSAVTNAKIPDATLESGYFKSELFADPEFVMYWRIMNDDEIEFALRVKTNTWVGLGWRPNTVTDTCRGFPDLASAPGGTPEGTPEGTPGTTPEGRKKRSAKFIFNESPAIRVRREAERNVIKELCEAGNVAGAISWANQNFNADGTSTPEGEPEGTAEPETNPEGTPEGNPEGTPEGNPEGTPETHPEGTAEPETNPEGTPEGNPEGTPEGNPEGTPEGNPEGTPEGNPEGTPEGNPEGTAAPEGNPEGNPEGTPEGTPEGSSTNLHPMDCQDIVIISAEGNRHRILDSYTRDRSTPRPDSFFGGTDDLTGAAALMEDGMVHAVFRRKLSTSDEADHDLPDGDTTFIWARGQDPNNFYHLPLTGLERCMASDYDYYRINELKYHGTKNTQRGTRTVNVYEDPNAETAAGTGSFGFPSGCSGTACTYEATWRYEESTSRVYFTLNADVALRQWAAIGFSDDQNMEETDAIAVWMDDAASEPLVTDRYITAKSPAGVSLDGTNDAYLVQGSHTNGRLSVEFWRTLSSPASSTNDKSLAQCRFFLYAWGGDVDGNDLSYHGFANRATSTQKICVSSGSTKMTASKKFLGALLVVGVFTITGIISLQ